MNSVTAEKPPWQQLKWTTNMSAFQNTDFLQSIQIGEWKEDPDNDLFLLKERIQPFDRTELWDLAKRITNPYERIHSISSRLNLPQSVCCIHPLSRSFFKMLEILQVMNFYERNKTKPKLRSLHLCEGPGGFIEAFLYKAEESKKTVQISYGMTLKSTHQMIPGWRRAAPFLQKHPNVKLIYGHTGTGDIYEPVNQDYTAEVCTPPPHLVTADGGFDFSDDFQAQEKTIFRLLVCSALIALRSIATDGDFVLKLFDIQSQVTRDFITILGSAFREWTLYKPVTSRPCNSEWYFLGRSAILDVRRGPIIYALTKIRDLLAEKHTIHALLASNDKNEFLLELQTARKEKQTDSLNRVLAYCEDLNRAQKDDALWEAQSEPSRYWCSTFKMPMNQMQTSKSQQMA